MGSNPSARSNKRTEKPVCKSKLKYIHTMKLSGITVPAAAVLILLLLASPAESAIQCSAVVRALSPCVKYLVNGGGSPPANCCSGISSLASSVSTAADRQTVCGCIKSAAKNIKPNDSAAKGLAGNCGVSLPVAVSPNIDCSKVS